MILIARGAKGELTGGEGGGGGVSQVQAHGSQHAGQLGTAHSTQTIVARIRESKQNTAFPEDGQSKTALCQNVLKVAGYICHSSFL